MQTNEILYNKAKFFKEGNVVVHILKKNGWFHNGEILDLEFDFLIIRDEKTGEMPIFFSEIIEIEKRVYRGGGNEV